MVCPCNSEIEFSPLKEFKPYEYMDKIDLIELMNLDNKIFKDKYKITSCGWRGKNIIKRNSMINALFIEKGKNITIEKETSPYIRDYYYRLLKFFKL